jgi:hypothetical protein
MKRGAAVGAKLQKGNLRLVERTDGGLYSVLFEKGSWKERQWPIYNPD